MNPPPCTSVADLLALIDTRVAPLPALALALDNAVGCVLAEDVFADADQPAFDRSSVDGFAVAAGSGTGSFALAGEVIPGDAAPATPGPGQAWRLFTGSAVPAGTALAMLEQADVAAGRVTLRSAATAEHIRRRGSSARAGVRLLAAGGRIGAGEAAVLASVGATSPKVIPRPRVLHITTGREIVASHAMPAAGQIRDTNGPLIRALLGESDAAAVPRIHVDESIASFVEAVQRAGEFDLLLASGGSSVGAHDHTPQALEALGFSLLSRRVNARPGKPLLLARRGQQWAFGLPGNPVSHFATYHVFVARALRRMAGRSADLPARARLGSGAKLAADSRETFWPARLERSGDSIVAHPLPWLDSGDLTALIGVDALIRLPPDLQPAVGKEVEIVLCGPPR
jgi:molybdopterin molybdotransferase